MAEKRGPGRPRQHETDGSAALARAATLRFATQGYDATSLREIAADAGVDVALVSYHFGSKTGLWNAIVSSAAADLQRALAEPLGDTDMADARDRLRGSMKAFVAYLLAHPELPRLLLRDITIDSERSDWLLRELSTPLHQHFYDLAQSAAADLPARPAHLQFRIANFIYSAASTVARRARLTKLVAGMGDDGEFAAALETTLIDQALRCG